MYLLGLFKNRDPSVLRVSFCFVLRRVRQDYICIFLRFRTCSVIQRKSHKARGLRLLFPDIFKAAALQKNNASGIFKPCPFRIYIGMGCVKIRSFLLSVDYKPVISLINNVLVFLYFKKIGSGLVKNNFGKIEP